MADRYGDQSALKMRRERWVYDALRPATISALRPNRSLEEML